jgi:hypothetical protein
MNLGGTSGFRLVSDWSDALWQSWGGWDGAVVGTGTARWQLGVFTSQITAVVIDYFCIIIECTLTFDKLTKDESKQERPRPDLPSYNPARQRIQKIYNLWCAGKWSKGLKLASRTSGFLDLSKDENRQRGCFMTTV